jgi:Protein of unknown function (DUF3455)
MRSKISKALLSTAIFAVAFTSCKKDQDPPDDLTEEVATLASFKHDAGIPDSLKVPEGNRLVESGFARGVQIYQVRRSASNPNVFTWVNIAPLATLYTKPNFTHQMALHFAGPTWEFTKGHNKGQRVVAKRIQGITKDPTAIQWLLLQAVDSLSSANNKITYIQRLFTVGGLAPTTGADEAHLGQLDSIPYTTLYLFYEAKH